MIDQVINLLAAITVLQMMVTIGLATPLREVGAALSQRGLVLRALLVNYVVVPGLTIALLLLFKPHPMVAAGFLVVAVCPGAPYGPPLTGLARGNPALAVAMMLILAATSALLAPLLLQLLMPLFSTDESLRISTGKILSTLLLIQLLPLCLGIYFRHHRLELAQRLAQPMARLSKLLNLALVALVLFAQFPALAEIRLIGWGGMLLLVAASGAAGWLAGGRDHVTARTLTIATATRNVGVGLVIASSAFPGTPAVAAATAFGLFQTLFMLLVAFTWRRLQSGEAPVAAGAQPAH